MATLRRIIEYAILLTILFLQIYLLLVALPEDNRLMKECNYKILCEKGLIDDPICKYKVNIPINISI
jgi:hypothetical protein